MKTLRDKVAAVTGAGSGIGRATAQALARAGCRLALSDVSESTLAETAESCRALGALVTQTRVDVADREAVHAWADAVVRDHGAAHIIINNAGVAVGATVETTSYEDFEWLMGINFWGVVHGTRAFLPHIKRAGVGAVVNVSSIFGIVSMPTQSAYNAAKFAVRGYTESLRSELAIEGSPIVVLCVHPGGIKTNIARSARTVASSGMIDADSARGFEKGFITSPDSAAEQIIAAMVKDRGRVLIGIDAKAAELVQRMFPVGYQRLVVAGGKFRRFQMQRKERA